MCWMRHGHVWKSYVTILILSMILKDIDSQFSRPLGFSLTAPRVVTVQRGLCVYIQCVFNIPPVHTLSENTRGYWFKGNPTIRDSVASRLVKDDIRDGRERFFITGQVQKGDCTLRITDARPEDANDYTFRIEDQGLQYSFVDDSTSLRVTEILDTPAIFPMRRLVAGEKVTLMCTSPGRCAGKAPSIIWNGKSTGISTNRYTVDNEDGTRTYHANITFTPSIEDDQSVLTCNVIFAEGATTSQHIVLEVDVAPTGRIPNPDLNPTPACSTVDYKLIVGIVAGNVLLLFIVFGLSCCFKQQLKKIQSENTQLRCGEQGENTYQELQGQTTSPYSAITRK